MRHRLCACSHEETRHELVNGKHAGKCLHGCGCSAFHGGRRPRAQRFVSPPEGGVEPSPAIKVALAALERARAAIHEAETALRAAPGVLRVVASRPPRALPAATSTPRPGSNAKGERRVLIAIAQDASGVTREQLTVLTGYKRSSRDTYLQRLRAQGLIEEVDRRIRATPAGITWLGPDYVPLPTGDALIEHWRTRLPSGELVIFDALLRAWPERVDREVLSESTGYKRSSRDTYLQRLCARELVWRHGDGSVSVADHLMAKRRSARGT